jgi:hypothetical protein
MHSVTNRRLCFVLAQQRAVNLKASARRYYQIANQAGENLPDKLKNDFRKVNETQHTDWHFSDYHFFSP